MTIDFKSITKHISVKPLLLSPIHYSWLLYALKIIILKVPTKTIKNINSLDSIINVGTTHVRVSDSLKLLMPLYYHIPMDLQKAVIITLKY